MSRYVTFVCLFLSAVSASAGTGNNVIMNFKYTSCSKRECVVVTAPKAWLSLIRGGFSTEGTTILNVFDPKGKLQSTASGSSATFNPDLELVVLEQTSGEVIMQRLDGAGGSP